jgi:nonsense-mediated mRNA decay protein 3
MSRSGEFCPRCGDTIESDGGAPLAETGDRREAALCDACYLEEFDLVDAPERVQVRVCGRCGAVHRGNRWVDVGAEDYTDVAVEETTQALSVHVDADQVAWQVTPEQVDPSTIRMHCEFSGVVRGHSVVEEAVVPVGIARETCDRCGRVAGGSYASIVQVRAVDRTPTADECEASEAIAHEVVDEMEATGDRDAFVTETSETHDGLNVKLSTNKIGKKVSRRIVERFGGTVDDNETLVTEDSDGNEVYRVTYAVRLPPYRPGEVIAPDEEGPVLVRSVQGNLKGVRLTTGEAYEAAFEDGAAPDATRLGTVEDAEETTLVAVEDENAVQVLDPETYEAKTIARPDYLDADADAVPVLKHRQGLHVVPSVDGDGDSEE